MFPTDLIRTQLGATTSSESFATRGILNLTSAQDILAEVAYLRNFWKRTSDSDTDAFSPNLAFENPFNRTTYPYLTVMVFYSLTVPLAMCLGCSRGSPNFIQQGSTVLATLFSDTIIDTDSPALALQALLTTILRTAYYSFLPTFDAESQVTVTSFRSAQVPLRSRGFWAVVGITLAHFVLCVVTLVGFILFTRVSSLKNAWQVIADVSENPETAAVLHDVGNRPDSEVAKSIEQDEGLCKRRFRLCDYTESVRDRAQS